MKNIESLQRKRIVEKRKKKITKKAIRNGIAFLGVFMVVIGVVMFRNSFAFFKKEIVAGNVDIRIDELQYDLKSESLTSNQITVEAGKSITFEVEITSKNPIASKYELYYNVSDETGLGIGYMENTVDAVSGVIDANGKKTVTIKIVNDGTSSKTITLGVEGGFERNELELTKGKKIVIKYLAPTISTIAFDIENLGENCKTYDDGVDTFLVGQCSQNYVWYSGKLWRVVLKNNATGAVKMITDNAMTSISYNSANQTDFDKSYADQWLSQEFLSTLHDYENYVIVDNKWEDNLIDSEPSQRPDGTRTLTRTVGLLNAYEYYVVSNQSSGVSHSENYLFNETEWCLLGNSLVNRAGYISVQSDYGSMGVRPSLNFRSSVKIISGQGLQSDPYRLENDTKSVISGTTLLSTRYSGEYVNFNNILFRIVETTDGKVKIVAVDSLTELGKLPFYNAVVTPPPLIDDKDDDESGRIDVETGMTDLLSERYSNVLFLGTRVLTNKVLPIASNPFTNFSDTTIKDKLEEYYQNMDSFYQNMIDISSIWYLGTVPDSYFNYKSSICSIIDENIGTKDCVKTNIISDATIGLPRVGEMFASQITRGIKNDFLTLNLASDTAVKCIANVNAAYSTSVSFPFAIRPSMYLKSNVVISSTNTGDGTYEHPYDIELAS